MDVRLAAHTSREQHQHSEDLEASHARLYDAQGDFKGLLRTLARQVESLHGGAHSGSPQPESSASVVMGVDDLKTKVTHPVERVEHCTRGLDNFVPARDKVDIPESQFGHWRRRFPRRSLGEDLEEIQSSIEFQTEFQEFQQSNRDRMWQLRHAIENIDAQMCYSQDSLQTAVSTG